jgi:AcrR family transcriptional regulator
MARPRSFNEDDILDIVTKLFWMHGYTATSLSLIIKATKLQKGSIYAAFGSKEELFKKCLARYMHHKYEAMQTTLDHSATAFAALEYFVQNEIQLISSSQQDNETTPKGCLITNSMIENDLNDEDIKTALLREHEKTYHSLSEIIRQAQGEGYLRLDLEAEAIAQNLQIFINAMHIYTRAGMSKSDIKDQYRVFMSTLKQIKDHST